MQAALNTVMGRPNFTQSDVIESNLQGRTAVVTGGTAGIGYEVARALALAHARVLLIAQTGEHGEDAVAKIKADQSTSGPMVDVTFVQCDLGNAHDVQRVADRIREQEGRLDLLICDAGVGVNKFDVSADGLDRHFSVNHLGHFLLTNRLLPLMRSTAALPGARPPRIVVVSSSLHTTAPSSVRFESEDELMPEADQLGAMQLYARSKLANLLFVRYGLTQGVLRAPPVSENSNSAVNGNGSGAHTHNGSGILALATHPGAVHTGQQDQFKEAYGMVFGTLLKYTTIPFMRAPDAGSLSTLWAATADDVERDEAKWAGAYVTDPGQAGGESSMAKDEQLGKNLWKLSEKLVRERLGQDGLLPWDEIKHRD
ncbi:NAD(P)-binding protein [Obba rivulosa]|uniref:NAD(P)-binding protein n=1 Tax=Obba rivulosa TaxID=1052685 RepID=A0A8E2J5M5_9APHY|nr:NAD(P)-binding protein [Obba rivulosa]